MAAQGYWNGNQFVLLPIPQNTQQPAIPGMPTPQAPAPMGQPQSNGSGGADRDMGANATGGGVAGQQGGYGSQLANGALSLAGLANPALGALSLGNKAADALFGQSLGNSLFGKGADYSFGNPGNNAAPFGYSFTGTNPDGGTYTGDFRGNPAGTGYSWNGVDYAPVERDYSGPASDSTNTDNQGNGQPGIDINGFAKGGMVTANRLTGPNPPGPDDGRANLQHGEYVVRKAATKKFHGLLAAINAGETDTNKLKGLL